MRVWFIANASIVNLHWFLILPFNLNSIQQQLQLQSQQQQERQKKWTDYKFPFVIMNDRLKSIFVLAKITKHPADPVALRTASVNRLKCTFIFFFFAATLHWADDFLFVFQIVFTLHPLHSFFSLSRYVECSFILCGTHEK